MAKKVTITYTREDLDTPWFWQVLNNSGSPSTDRNFITENSDKIEQNGYFAAQGYKNIITFTFTDQQIYEEWAALVQANVAPGYIEYCENNNITIEFVTEDI
jgi:hypothetical protein